MNTLIRCEARVEMEAVVCPFWLIAPRDIRLIKGDLPPSNGRTILALLFRCRQEADYTVRSDISLISAENDVLQ
jgi:hypothetical protein